MSAPSWESAPPELWNYLGKPEPGKDARKFCTIEQGGMMWVGIRAWDSTRNCWLSNGEPCPNERVKAWMDLPEPARKFWDHGILHDPWKPPSMRRPERAP